ncbi:MAG: type I restriction enzyme HsdR N-terminal domain-containing protein [Porphyromonas sp.]|nr:type I restriction enzyme HsdR N-terminal domain-containing protein [Porphyromonas sp.]
MNTLNLPPYNLKLREEESGKLYVFDDFREKYVRFTPEEEVRQLFVHYMVCQLGYPPNLLANEVEIEVGRVRKRCDTIVYDKALKPILIVEYKSPRVSITQAVIQQAVEYNYCCRVPYIMISNGITHAVFAIDYQSGEVEAMDHIPSYSELTQTSW